MAAWPTVTRPCGWTAKCPPPSSPATRLHARKGNTDKALADFTLALQLDDQLADAYRDRAAVYWSRNDVTAALADYTHATALAPDDVEAHRGRGRALAARAITPGPSSRSPRPSVSRPSMPLPTSNAAGLAFAPATATPACATSDALYACNPR